MPLTYPSRLDFRHVSFQGRKITPRTVVAPVKRAPTSVPLPALPANGLLPAEDIEFIHLVLTRFRLEPARYRPDPLIRRLPACLRALRVTNVSEARAAIACRPEALQTAVNALLLGVTEFFRDRAVFEALREQVLPTLAAQQGTLSIWSAACANGAELYSLAWLLAEQGLLPRARLLGTDCRSEAIAAAREGRFRRLQPAGGTESLHLLKALNGEMYVPAGVRKHIRWAVGDVFKCRDQALWDLILCRNLAIYLELSAGEELWRILAAALKPGGFLIIGKAERPGRGLGLSRIVPCIYRREGAPCR